MSGATAVNLHASAVALDAESGVLILGASGSGKSAMALQLMAFGARLVADDRVDLHLREGAIRASAPSALRGLIEARGVGLLGATPLDGARIVLVVDLDRTEGDRLPPDLHHVILGVSLPLARNCPMPHFPAAILQYLRGGRVA